MPTRYFVHPDAARMWPKLDISDPNNIVGVSGVYCACLAMHDDGSSTQHFSDGTEKTTKPGWTLQNANVSALIEVAELPPLGSV